MDQELSAIKSAAEEFPRDEAAVRRLADAFVAAHPELFTSLADMTLEQCVSAVDVFRAAGMANDLWRVEAWLLHKFEPQNIGGPAQVALRTPNG